jgi:magnesium transporter
MLVNCIAYEDGKKLAEIPIKDISDYLQRPDCFVWVALKDPTVPELAEMQEEFTLHPLAVEDAQVGHQRPKLEEYGESVFAVMHLVEMTIKDGGIAELGVGEIDVFVGRNYVLSVRSRSQQQFMGVRARLEREPHLLRQGSGFVLYALIDAVVDRYFPIIDAIEAELEHIEQQIFARANAREMTQKLYALKERVVVMKHAVFPLMEVAAKLSGGRVPSVCANTQEYFRDVYDHLVRLNTSLDTIRDTIASAMQVNLALTTIDEAETTKRLTAWAAIFALPMVFEGIWGMNFKYMPELEATWGYPMALGVIAVGCILLYRGFKKSGWL